MSDPIVIVSVARTPMGGMLSSLSGLAAHELGSVAIKAAVERASSPSRSTKSSWATCCRPARARRPPARPRWARACRWAWPAPPSTGLRLGPEGGAQACRCVACTTIHKVCGSGLKAAMFGHDLLASGSATIVVAGGQESMSNAPYLMLKGRQGYRYGHSTVYDHMALDGLEDAYDKGKAMGVFAETARQVFLHPRTGTPSRWNRCAAPAPPRKTAASSGNRPRHRGRPQGRHRDRHRRGPTKAMPEKIPTLKPAFKKDGTVTAANSSSISDGAAAMVLMRASTAENSASSRWPASWPTASTRRNRTGSPPPRGRAEEPVRQDRLEGRGRGPVRDQRSLRRGHHGRHDRLQAPA